MQKIGPRRQKKKSDQQVGRGLNQNTISTAIEHGRRAAGSRFGKMIINDAINYSPTTYKKITNKIKSKKLLWCWILL